MQNYYLQTREEKYNLIHRAINEIVRIFVNFDNVREFWLSWGSELQVL